ncbi:carbohydrate ABC transporter permease [Paenibacillus sp. YN15]|uniref:carbohydrate ABC transporter permease n=1 Tax=Paenibacillus sp. YN15 TaxID=1742774 RepID=UPI000DCCC972|nr:carbohydrate ABC transporter permease [Paenibacillus sp. YN15]RAV06384.1 ABC transporter permease [Paenibacillus sp. YN15]
MKRCAGDIAFDSVNYMLLFFLGLATLYPFLYVLGVSLSSAQEVNVIGLRLFPSEPTLEVYRKVLESSKLYSAYMYTIIRTVLGVSLTVFLVTLTAYPLAKKSLPHRGLLMKLLVFSMLFNGGLIPSYLLIKNLGLIDSIWALVLPGAVGAFNLIIVRNFFESIPAEVLESARMDGAGEMMIYARIMLPLSIPILAVIALWSAVSHWNAWFDAMIYINDTKRQVLQLFIRRTVLENSGTIVDDQAMLDPAMITPQNLKAALIMVVMLPILCVYPFIQRFFTKGIMLGSVKG